MCVGGWGWGWAWGSEEARKEVELEAVIKCPTWMLGPAQVLCKNSTVLTNEPSLQSQDFYLKKTLSAIVIIVNVKELQISWWCLLAGKLRCPLLSEFAKRMFMVETANLLSQTLNLDRKEQEFWDHLALLTELLSPQFICCCLPSFSEPLRMTVCRQD